MLFPKRCAKIGFCPQTPKGGLSVADPVTFAIGLDG